MTKGFADRVFRVRLPRFVGQVLGVNIPTGERLKTDIDPQTQSANFQTFRALAPNPVASRFPSGLNATPRAWGTRLFPVSKKTKSSLALAASHTLAAPSLLMEATRLPSGLNATSQTC